MTLKVRVRFRRLVEDEYREIMIPTFYGEDLDDIQKQCERAIEYFLKKDPLSRFNYTIL